MIKTKLIKTVLAITTATLIFASNAFAQWTLDADSSNISYGTIKNDIIGETNTFTDISGTIDENGNIDINIALASVDTMIPQRDERMRNIVFKIPNNVSATLSGTVDLAAHSDQAVGTSQIVEADIGLKMLGSESELYTNLVVTRIAEDKVMVTPHGVVFLYPEEFELLEAIEELRDIAGLDTITPVVPMSFYLTFTK